MISLKIKKGNKLPAKTKLQGKDITQGCMRGRYFVQEEEKDDDDIVIAPWRILCIKCTQPHSTQFFNKLWTTTGQNVLDHLVVVY